MRFATLLRGVIVWLFPFLVLAACEDPTEPEVEEIETFEFSATVERTGDLGGLLAHHEVGATPSPWDFIWPSTFGYGRIGTWEPDSSPAHTFGVEMGGFGGLTPGETFNIKFHLEWVNGKTAKPFDFSLGAALFVGRYQEKYSEEVKVPYTLREIAPNHYRAQITIPSDPTWSYSVYMLPDITLSCNDEGVKSLLVSDVSFSGAGFRPGKREGSLLITGECDRPLIRYSRVAG